VSGGAGTGGDGMRGTGARRVLSFKMTELRRDIACVLVGFFIANFGTTLWLTNLYIATRPATPNPSLGLIFALNVHGSLHYLTRIESASVTLTFWCGWIAFVVLVIVVPKYFIIPPPKTPRWITYVSASYKTGLEQFSLRYFTIMLLALLVSVALMILFGKDFAQFAISHGIAAS
jgi:hypothetical protein